MKRTIIGFCLVFLVGYVLVTLANLPTTNVGLLKLRGFCRFCDLTNVNLEAMDLHGADLSFATLNGANLKTANFDAANLTRANLSGADLTKASLNGTNLYYATLNGANLTGVNLNAVNLYYATLNEVNITEAINGWCSIEEEENLGGAICCNTTMPDGIIDNSGCK